MIAGRLSGLEALKQHKSQTRPGYVDDAVTTLQKVGSLIKVIKVLAWGQKGPQDGPDLRVRHKKYTYTYLSPLLFLLKIFNLCFQFNVFSRFDCYKGALQE